MGCPGGPGHTLDFAPAQLFFYSVTTRPAIGPRRGQVALSSLRQPRRRSACLPRDAASALHLPGHDATSALRLRLAASPPHDAASAFRLRLAASSPPHDAHARAASCRQERSGVRRTAGARRCGGGRISSGDRLGRLRPALRACAPAALLPAAVCPHAFNQEFVNHEEEREGWGHCIAFPENCSKEACCNKLFTVVP